MEKKKMGRPRKPVESEEQAIVRAWWRKSAARYYKENREVVLQRAKKEVED